MLIMFNICSEVEWKSDGVQAANAELFQLKAIKVPVTYCACFAHKRGQGRGQKWGQQTGGYQLDHEKVTFQGYLLSLRHPQESQV